MSDATKPLGRKAYGSIGHLAGSRMGPADHQVHEGQARICTTKARKGDTIVVQEKLDGSCVAVAKLDGQIVPLIRAGYRARDSRRDFHREFHTWAMEHWQPFDWLLKEGDRVVGEWIALAHGTRYQGLQEPFVAFDIMRGQDRAIANEVADRCANAGVEFVDTIHFGEPIAVTSALELLGPSGEYFANPRDGVEGIVYRVEREGKVDFLAKWVNPLKVDGKFLSDISGEPDVWNWRPEATP